MTLSSGINHLQQVGSEDFSLHRPRSAVGGQCFGGLCRAPHNDEPPRFDHAQDLSDGFAVRTPLKVDEL